MQEIGKTFKKIFPFRLQFVFLSLSLIVKKSILLGNYANR